MKANFTVIWSELADQELTEIWLRATDRQSLTLIINDFDAALKSAPQAIVAEDREGLRIATLSSLRVTFSVSEDDRIVNVLIVREIH